MGSSASTYESVERPRFRIVRRLHHGTAFHLDKVLDDRSGAPWVVVRPAVDRDLPRQRTALAALTRTHRRLAGHHARIGRVAAASTDEGEHDEDGLPWVAFAFDAVCTLDRVITELRRKKRVPLRHEEADAFIVGLREALQAAHTVPAPEAGGGPTCIGSLGYGNVLLDTTGEQILLGFGHNVVTTDEAFVPAAGLQVFQPPERFFGAPPSPSGDFVALISLLRASMSVVRLSTRVARAIAQNSIADDVELVQQLLWFERSVMAAMPNERATIPEAIATSNRIRQLLDVTPDRPSLMVRLRELVKVIAETETRPADEPPTSDAAPSGNVALEVGPEGAWYVAPDGSRWDLHTRGPLRRILLALTDARLHRRGQPLSTHAILGAGWPGEAPVADTGPNRAYVMVNELRRKGLRSILQRTEGGYRLDPNVPTILVPDPQSGVGGR
jgi:hypothetical protein